MTDATCDATLVSSCFRLDGAQDYLYNHLDTRDLPDGRALWLIDLKGTQLSRTSLTFAICNGLSWEHPLLTIVNSTRCS